MNLKPLEDLFTCLLFGRQWILLVQRYFPFAFTNNFPFHRSVSAAISRCFLSGLTTVTSAAGEMVQKNKMRRREKSERTVPENSQYSLVVLLDGNRLLNLSALPYCTSQAEVSTAGEDVENLVSEAVSQF